MRLKQEESLGYRRIAKLVDIPSGTIGNWLYHGKKPRSAWTEDNHRRFREKCAESKKGAENPNWKGDKASQHAGQARAVRLFSAPKGYDRHHIDGNTLNNEPNNVFIISRKEHMIIDGRMENFKGKALDKHPMWKGDEASEKAKYHRAYRRRKGMVK